MSEALRLAQELDAYHTRAEHKMAAAELRRLHASNQALLEALKSLLWYVGQLEMVVYSVNDTGEHEDVAQAHAAIKAAEEKT